MGSIKSFFDTTKWNRDKKSVEGGENNQIFNLELFQIKKSFHIFAAET